MTLLRAQVVLRHRGSLPRDAVSNVFHFNAPSGSASAAEAVAELVRDAYALTVGNNSLPLSSYLSASIADTGHQVRVYEYNVATGARVPYEGAPPTWVEEFDFVSRDDETMGMPAEVALCLTMRNTSVANVPMARRRGRVYFGPFESQYIQEDFDTRRVRPSTIIQNAVLEVGRHLKFSPDAAAGDLVVYSRPFAGRDAIPRPGRTTLPALPARPGAIYSVDRFEVDDAFDTQRRRGERPVNRLSVDS